MLSTTLLSFFHLFQYYFKSPRAKKFNKGQLKARSIVQWYEKGLQVFETKASWSPRGLLQKEPQLLITFPPLNFSWIVERQWARQHERRISFSPFSIFLRYWKISFWSSCLGEPNHVPVCVHTIHKAKNLNSWCLGVKFNCWRLNLSVRKLGNNAPSETLILIAVS